MRFRNEEKSRIDETDEAASVDATILLYTAAPFAMPGIDFSLPKTKTTCPLNFCPFVQDQELARARPWLTVTVFTISEMLS